MRDLARGGVIARRRFSRRRIFVVAGIVIVIGAVLSYMGGRATSGSGTGGDVVLTDAPPNLKPVSLAGIEKKADDGVDLKTETASMKDLRYDGGARAAVTRTFGAGVYKLDVSATLPDPVNVNYAVWLDGPGGPVLIDYLRGSGTAWSLGISGSSDKYLKYGKVIITLERNKDNIPEERVMEGSF